MAEIKKKTTTRKKKTTAKKEVKDTGAMQEFVDSMTGINTSDIAKTSNSGIVGHIEGITESNGRIDMETEAPYELIGVDLGEEGGGHTETNVYNVKVNSSIKEIEVTMDLIENKTNDMVGVPKEYTMTENERGNISNEMMQVVGGDNSPIPGSIESKIDDMVRQEHEELIEGKDENQEPKKEDKPRTFPIRYVSSHLGVSYD